jgi:hypothetical protein
MIAKTLNEIYQEIADYISEDCSRYADTLFGNYDESKLRNSLIFSFAKIPDWEWPCVSVAYTSKENVCFRSLKGKGFSLYGDEDSGKELLAQFFYVVSRLALVDPDHEEQVARRFQLGYNQFALKSGYDLMSFDFAEYVLDQHFEMIRKLVSHAMLTTPN